MSAPARPLRRGLPRVRGGAPWPATADVVVPQDEVPDASLAAPGAPPSQREVVLDHGDTTLRRGLPRRRGGEPWPPAFTISEPRPSAAEPTTSPTDARRRVEQAPAREPLTLTPTAWPGVAASAPRPVARQAAKRGPFTAAQWTGIVVVLCGTLLVAAAMAVALVRWLLSTDAFQEFLVRYPGEYHLPAGAPVGLPGWLGWQHFFNAFLMVLIIRTGLQVRREKRPTVFWSPRGRSERKISLTLWFHQGLDLLWLANGIAFVVLLFVSGQWMRIVPTSWEVFPNAVSAALQYVSLDWPTENGWVNYNSLQQLAYFASVFVAAPLAVASGVRMSGIWPANAPQANRLYPVEWARRIHFPVMLFFVGFIVVHVALVFATGALRNLNHVYAAQGSTDPDAYADNWLGFWIFAASMILLAAVWIAARPTVLAPVARLFGSVSR